MSAQSEWVSTEELFKKFPALLGSAHAHERRVLEHWLGPELDKFYLEKIVECIGKGDRKSFVWFIGCYVMRVFPEDKHMDFGWNRLKDPRVERVVDLLLEAPHLS